MSEPVETSRGRVSEARALTRGTVRRALGSQPWAEPLLFLFSPVFALLSLVTPEADQRMRWVWAALAAAAGVVAVFSFAEQRRRVAFVLELCRRRRELAMGTFVLDGEVLRRDTALYSYPIQASFFVVAMRTTTCPSLRPRPIARALAVLMNLCIGWWSVTGLARTPLCLWRCVRGGDVTTPAELIDVVDAHERAVRERPPSVGIKVLLLVMLGMAVLFGLALLIVTITV